MRKLWILGLIVGCRLAGPTDKPNEPSVVDSDPVDTDLQDTDVVADDTGDFGDSVLDTAVGEDDDTGDTSVPPLGPDTDTPPDTDTDTLPDTDDSDVLPDTDVPDSDSDAPDTDADTGVVVVGPMDGDGDGFVDTVDCDDADPTVFPGAPELCNAVDDDCDGLVDRQELGFRYAYFFDGGLEYAGESAFSFPAGLTIETWVWFDAPDPDPAAKRLLELTGATTSARLTVELQPLTNEVEIEVVDDAGLMASGVVGVGGVSDWRHLALVVDTASDVVTVYVNGAVSGSVAAPGMQGLQLDGGLVISRGTPEQQWWGGLDDFRIWSGVLDAATLSGQICGAPDRSHPDLLMDLDFEGATFELADVGPLALEPTWNGNVSFDVRP